MVMRTVFAAAIHVVDAALGLCPECDDHVQRADRQVPFHPISDRPTDDTTGMQVQDESQV